MSTVTEMANAIYPNQTYDTALPLHWVKGMQSRGFEPVGHFVTLYPKLANGISFYMAPITPEGIEMAARVCSSEA